MSDGSASNQSDRGRRHSGAHGPLLLSKLRAPRTVSDHVLRPRLIQLIEEGVDRKLTLVITPAGYGKSTLVEQWMSQSSLACGWISLDDSDNDFLRFLDYVVAAIHSINPSLCVGTEALLRASPPPPTLELIHSLINEVTAATRKFVLVFDDYHVITSLEVHNAILQLVQQMPPNLAVVILSRQEPNLPTMRMEARGELLELGIKDLSFTSEETAEFLIDRQGLSLSEADVAEIDRWAEGWPVALRLLSSAIRGKSQQETREIIDSLAHNVPSVGSFLWDEIIRAQPALRREFLLQTSILEQFSPELCAAVTESPDAADQLAGLERDNLFISRLNGPGNWYRYHHLFAEVLRQQWESEAGPELARELHARAARWYEERLLITEAAHHAIRAERWELATELLVQICQELYDSERIGNLLMWLRDLPDEPLKLDSRLAYWLAWAHIRAGHRREALRVIAIAEEAASIQPSPEATRAARQLLVIKSRYSSDLSQGEPAARLLLQELGPEDESDRARILIILALLQQTGGKLAESERSLEEARTVIDRLGVRGFHVVELAASAALQCEMGKLKEPATVLRRAIAIGDEWNDLPLQYSHHKLGEILYEWNLLDEAHDQTEIAERLMRQMGAQIHQTPISLLNARIAAANGQWDLAFDEVERGIASGAVTGQTGIIPDLERFKCHLWLATDQLTLAQGWLRHNGPAAFDTTEFQEFPDALTGVRIRMHEGRGVETLKPLARLGELARDRGWNRTLLTIQTLRSIVELEAGQNQFSQEAIEEALQLGVDEGFVRSFLDEGSRLHPVLELAAAGDGPIQSYAKALLGTAGVGQPADPVSLDRAPGILSPRERDVMRLVASGLSNREVGDALFISEETVKTHLRRIFEKLEVSSRTQAVLRSQQLDLL